MSGIQIENLVKTYGDNIAVNGLNLNLEKGKVYGFLGPNGAGKSTTMNIITGYIGATSGTVKIDGYDIFKEPEKAKKCVGYLPEIPPLYQDMTVKEYLVFVAELKKIPSKEKMKNIKEVLEMTKTTQVENRLIKNLSKGYKQRVGDVFEYEFAESEAENIVRLKIKSDRDVDLREKIFYICAENDLPIMEMSFKQKTLEDIFIELTKDYAAPEKKSRFKKKKDKQEEEDNVSDL